MAKDSRDEFDDSNEIWVTKFDEDSAQKFRNRVLDKVKESTTEPIVIYIDSYGGYVDSLAKMIETMDEVPNRFITVCMGKAMSCGAVLLSHGDLRYVGRHSRVMVHEVSNWTAGDVHDMNNDAIETKRLNSYFLGLLARNCNIKGGYDGLRRIIKTRDGRDIYLDAAESVKFGIADAVGIPKVLNITFHESLTVPEKRRNSNKNSRLRKK